MQGKKVEEARGDLTAGRGAGRTKSWPAGAAAGTSGGVSDSARTLACCLLGLAPAGCIDISFGGGGSGAHGGGATPGERDMGIYQVQAAQTLASCGQGALGAPPAYDFLVEISRTHGTLFWHSGDSYTAGTMDDDGFFRLETSTSTNMRDEMQGWMPPCSIRRVDAADARFDNPRAPRSFSGKMTYSFTPEPGSDCIDLVTGEGAAPDSVPLFATLPCQIGYDLDADRTDLAVEEP